MSDAQFPDSPLEFGMFDWIESSEAAPCDIFEHRLQLAEAADRAGFFGWHIAEHQGTPLSIDVSPALILASAIQRTQQLRLGALTFCLPWYSPYRFYNEVCMLDQLSRGRIELGVGRGISVYESAYYGIKSIDESRERYRETLDIFMAACRSEVLNHDGKYFSYRDLELYNHPYQRPYPPLWFPSSDRNSMDFVASHGYHTVVNLPTSEVRGLYEQYRESWVRHHDDPGRHNAHVAAPKLGKSQHILVADTDAEAIEIGHAAYGVWQSHMTHLTRKNQVPDQVPGLSASSPEAPSRFVGGSPKTVVQELTQIVKDTTINYLMLVFSFGNLRPDQAMHSMDLFTTEVMPALRAIFPRD